MTTFLGIDIAKETFEVKLIGDHFNPQHASFANTRSGFNKLHRFLKKRQLPDVHICMEATGVYYEALAEFLHQKGYAVSVVNPARIHAYADSQLRRNKTDKLDATVIADFCRTQNPPLWTPPDPYWYQLRDLVRHLEDLESDRQRQRNRLDARQSAYQSTPAVLANLQEQIDFLDGQIETVKQRIQDHIDQQPDLKRQRDLLVTIEGVGRLTAAKLLAEFRDFSAFDNVRQVVAFAGLNPQQKQSGTSVKGKPSISKIGQASIRATLYMPALVAKKHNSLLQPFVQRLEARGLRAMEIVVAVMRKLLHLAYGILKSGQPFDPNYLEKEVAIA